MVIGVSIGVIIILVGAVPVTSIATDVSVETTTCRAVERRTVRCGFSSWWTCTEHRFQTKTCFINPPVDGGWSNYTEWTRSTCSVTCGEGTAYRSRSRTCNTPKPSQGGKGCKGEANQTEIVTCRAKDCPINGGWSNYTEWTPTECSVSCGGGTLSRSRNRTCNNPEPTPTGKPCKGKMVQIEVKPCNTKRCPVNGGWSNYTEWTSTECSVSCGGGTLSRSRNRTCNNPEPTPTGKPCKGKMVQIEVKPCNTERCSVDGGWSNYTEWTSTECSVSCGGGTLSRSRNRTCNNPEPTPTDRPCKGKMKQIEVKPCNRKKCPGQLSSTGTPAPSVTPVPNDVTTVEPSVTPVPNDVTTADPSVTSVPSDEAPATPPVTPVPIDVITTRPSSTPVPSDVATAAPPVTPVPNDVTTARLSSTPVPSDVATAAPPVTPVPNDVTTARPSVPSETEVGDIPRVITRDIEDMTARSKNLKRKRSVRTKKDIGSTDNDVEAL